jgi:hypothetical protein
MKSFEVGTYNADGTHNAMNAAWGGQWDRGEIMTSMGAHATTENLAVYHGYLVLGERGAMPFQTERNYNN